VATTYYASITNDVRSMKDLGAPDDAGTTDGHVGTASTAADIIELRMGNGTYLPSREEVLLALLRFERWVVQGGLNQAGANLPIPASGTHG
jgi:hypothetical protein